MRWYGGLGVKGRQDTLGRQDLSSLCKLARLDRVGEHGGLGCLSLKAMSACWTGFAW